MTNSQRQHGIGSLAPNEQIVGKPGGLVEPGVKQYGIFKKIKKFGKKVFKSKLGKAALLGLGAYGLGGAGFLGGKGIFAAGQGMQRFRNLANIGSAMRRGLFGSAASTGLSPRHPAYQAGKKGLWGKIGDFGYGKSALLGLGAAGVAAPFLGEDEEEDIDDWSVSPSSISKITQMAKDRHPSLAFLPRPEYVQSGYYGSKEGGIVGLANGGGAANAQAEQMLRMEYQKYRNQGGTMSYQQFKMAVLQQAQGQGPMAQGQPQMAAQGGRMGYNRGRVVNPGGYSGAIDRNIANLKTAWELDTDPDKKAEIKILLDEQIEAKGGFADKMLSGDPVKKEEGNFWDFLPFVGKAQGGRIKYQGGELVEDASMVEETPAGMMEENVEEVQGEPTREQLEALAMEIFQLRLEELDEEQLMVVYQAAMEQQPEAMAMQEEDVQFNPQMMANGGLIGSHVPGYTTPPGYNTFDYPSGGVRVGRAEGGLMSLGGMEKDYRQEGGFVPLGGKEKADDVPARLSKNEFVFTADAVRNAGGGDIDSGAEVMQNVMDNLESGGEISEESQGAQGMYNQQQMLQSRME
jgi:hypothetical protein